MALGTGVTITFGSLLTSATVLEARHEGMEREIIDAPLLSTTGSIPKEAGKAYNLGRLTGVCEHVMTVDVYTLMTATGATVTVVPPEAGTNHHNFTGALARYEPRWDFEGRRVADFTVELSGTPTITAT